jgi:hypothetical protein
MMGKPAPSSARSWRITALLASKTGAPERPPVSSACGRPCTFSREIVVLVAITPSRPCRRSVAAMTWICSRRDRARSSGTSAPGFAVAARRAIKRRPPFDQRAEQGVERLVALERAQVLRVRARDVDRDVVRVRDTPASRPAR